MPRSLIISFVSLLLVSSPTFLSATLSQISDQEAYIKVQEKRSAAVKKQDLMDEALELLSESNSYWVKGDFEGALDLLDLAYALLLDTNGNPEIARQKDDIRLMISKKILAIYSSQITSANGIRSEIPLIMNEEVEKEIRSFQTIERNFFTRSYQRSFIYLPYILKELNKAGIPDELAWLPLVESGFMIRALSPARALGLWQFIPSTGYKFGLNRCDWIDERMDLEKSTRAAIAYLKELHGMFGDWLTVLAAYNCGEGRVLRVISRQHINYFDRFWDLYNQLPYETARYVPRFLATLHIINNPQKYGFDFDVEGNDKKWVYSYESVRVDRPMRLSDVAQLANISEETLEILNAELRQKMTPDREYLLKIPSESVNTFLEIAESIPQAKKRIIKVVRHRVKKGDTIESIAKTYNIPSKDLRASFAASGRKKLTTGKFITVPLTQSGDILSDNRDRKLKKTPNKQQADQKKAAPPKDMKKASGKDSSSGKIYVVNKGDNLNIIARKNNTSVERIIKNNNITRRDNIVPGQRLVIN